MAFGQLQRRNDSFVWLKGEVIVMGIRWLIIGLVGLSVMPAAMAQQADHPLPKTWRNSIGMEFVLIPAGTFEMGASDVNADSDEQPVHRVTISRAFYLSTYEVTQRQWLAVMDDNPSFFKGTDMPVESLPWYDAKLFIHRLNQREKTGSYRLPTEAEWEYAARAGTQTVYSFGDDVHQLPTYAWFAGNAAKQPHAVGQHPPNSWGLYDMHGNVWEWGQDSYSPYSPQAVTDPVGPEDVSHRIIRGGSWLDTAEKCRSSYRLYRHPIDRDGTIGFRLLKMVE
ncbi:formylglycine-generating enzyme family protein [Candidatus Entotheonella serta]|nr:formylglycine-generating enzyme family protein [Candidatus Entotheonella serta]